MAYIKVHDSSTNSSIVINIEYFVSANKDKAQGHTLITCRSPKSNSPVFVKVNEAPEVIMAKINEIDPSVKILKLHLASANIPVVISRDYIAFIGKEKKQADCVKIKMSAGDDINVIESADKIYQMLSKADNHIEEHTVQD